jgi:hypothetical protein
MAPPSRVVDPLSPPYAPVPIPRHGLHSPTPRACCPHYIWCSRASPKRARRTRHKCRRLHPPGEERPRPVRWCLARPALRPDPPPVLGAETVHQSPRLLWGRQGTRLNARFGGRPAASRNLAPWARTRWHPCTCTCAHGTFSGLSPSAACSFSSARSRSLMCCTGIVGSPFPGLVRELGTPQY